MSKAHYQSRWEYEVDVCERLQGAQVVPQKKVSVGDWQPEIGKCHDNVDRWATANPNHSALRGWVAFLSYGEGMFGVTAHSVVRDVDGHLFDITPLSDERIREGMLFVPHLGDEASFHELRSGTGISFTCPPGLLDNVQQMFSDPGQDPFNNYRSD